MPAVLTRYFMGWAAGVLSAAAVAMGLVAWILFGGGYNASARKQHTRPVAWAAQTAMTHWVAARAKGVRPPSGFTLPEVMAGARAYEEHCIACHGGPAVARAPWASAMVPTPPYLIDASWRWSAAELYTIIRDGIKMTAMPAWGEVEPDQMIWDLVAFLEALPQLSPSEFARIRSQVTALTPTARAGSDLNAFTAPIALKAIEPQLR